MNKEQKNHIERIRSKFMKLAWEKYQKGAKEHGSNLLTMDEKRLLKEMRDEAIDLFIYAETALEKLEKAVKHGSSSLSS